MRAKNEFRKIAASYDTKLILERVVDGKLMCPEACCGSPVMECKCGPDCPHCNCHEIQKLAGKDKTIKEFYKMRDPDGDGSWPDDDDDRSDHPDWGEPEYGDTTGEYGEDEERVRLTLDSPGTASVQLPKGDPRIQKYLDLGYKIVKDYKKAEQSEDSEDSIVPEDERDEPIRNRDKNKEFADSLWSKDPKDLAQRRRAAERDLGKRRNPRPKHLFTKGEDNKDPKRGITGHQHTDALAQAALSKDYKHKPYVSSYVGGESDGFRKIFAVLGSDGKIAHKTRDKREAHQWLKDNYENI